MEDNIILGRLLNGKISGVFINDAGEYCRVTNYYIKNTHKFSICFYTEDKTVSRLPITTTVSKKILKILNEENFKLI